MTIDIRRLELAVIAIAQKWRSDVLAGASNDIRNENIATLRERVDALTYACDECNAGGHTCPGDGNPIPHGANDCGQHTHAGADGACPDYGSALDPCPKDCALGECTNSETYIERKKWECWLAEAFLECGGEWLTYAEGPGGEQIKIEHHGDSVTRLLYADGLEFIGDFHVTASARRLPPPCPESDGAPQAELAERDRALSEQLAEDDEALRAELADAAAHTPQWVPRTWADVRTGDRVRLPGTDSTALVEHAQRQAWHVDPRSGTSSYNPPRPLEWSGVKVSLRPAERPDQVAEFTMDPAKDVEIRLSPLELQAIELLGWSNRIEIQEA